MVNLRGIIQVFYKDGSTWVDATSGLLQADITRGIPQYYGCWSQVSPGQLRIRTKNLDLDPARNANIELYSLIKITANGVPIFTGKLIDVETEYFPKDDAIVTLNIFDELGILSLRKFGNITVINQDYAAKTVIVPTNMYALLSNDSGILAEDNIGAGTGVQALGSYQYGYQENPKLGYSGDDIIVHTVGGNTTPGAWGSRVVTSPTLFTGIDPDGIDGIWADKPGSAAKPGFINAPATGSAYGEWCALTTTTDTDALTLFLKAEQSEAGFAYVDASNKFVLMSRPYIDNTTSWTSQARFASDGSGISYNNIKVTNGWESVVKGVTVSNTWTNSFCDWDQNLSERDLLNNGSTTGYYQNAAITNRDGTTTAKILNPNPAPNLVYPWLPYAAVETQARYQKYAKTTVASGSKTPIYDIQTRDWDITKLTTKSIFKGSSSINGSNQLYLNTNYTMTGSTGGGYIYNRNGVITNLPATPDAYRDNVSDRMNELADEIISLYSTPVIDVRSISFEVHPDDIDDIASIDVFDRIDLDHNHDGFAVDKQYAVMGIKQTITPNNWNVTYELWNQQGRP